MSASDHLHPTQFVRFGDLPKGGRSRNNATGDLERGVSVYNMHRETGHPVDPDPDGMSDSPWTAADLNDRVEQAHRGELSAHIVTGEQVGKGHDGEPLLRKVKRIRPWP